MTDTDKPKLKLESLHERHIGLTVPLSGTYFEAASVCLSRHHQSPIEVEIVCNGVVKVRTVEFPNPDARTLNAWANNIETTENGAYGLCLAALEAEEKMVAVRRAETLTGAD